MAESTQSLIKFKNLKMKLSTTILACFSSTQGFNTGTNHQQKFIYPRWIDQKNQIERC